MIPCDIHLLLMHEEVMMKLRPQELLILIELGRPHGLLLVQMVRARVVPQRKIVV
jgi:hypothetical protein